MPILMDSCQHVIIMRVSYFNNGLTKANLENTVIVLSVKGFPMKQAELELDLPNLSFKNRQECHVILVLGRHM